MGKRLIGSVGLKPGTDTGFDLDEKGQIHSYSDTQFALPVGDDNQILSSLASEASGLKWIDSSSGANTALSNLASVAVNDTIDMNTNNLTNTQFFGCKNYIEKTISSGAITFTQSLTSVDTEADASTDDLDYFNALVSGYFLVLKSEDAARDPTLRSGITGDTKMSGPGNYTLADDAYRWIGNCYVDNNFSIQELSRSSNTA
tara:strand:- start:72 stop:677 length:606 start_codon:yes stop_codon:yes gene_type:complete